MTMIRKDNFVNSKNGVFSIDEKQFPKLNMSQQGDRRDDSLYIILNSNNSIKFKFFSSYKEHKYIPDKGLFSDFVEIRSEETPSFTFVSSSVPNERQFDISEGRYFLPNFGKNRKVLNFYEFPDSSSKYHKIEINSNVFLHTVMSLYNSIDKRSGFDLVYFRKKTSNKNGSVKYSEYEHHYWIKDDDLQQNFYRQRY